MEKMLPGRTMGICLLVFLLAGSLALVDVSSSPAASPIGHIVTAWGGNSDGQCDAPAPNSGFTAVSAGGDHSLGLRSDGSIAAWGANSGGQLNVPAPNSGFTAVSAGDYHSLGLRSDGSIAAWGWNSNGQCNVPALNSGFVAISAGGDHSLGLKADGSIAAWGGNSYGQLNVPAPNSGFLAISAGFLHSLGLRSDGSIAAWGYNGYGQLNVPAPNLGFTAVAAGEGHSLGLRSDGSIAAWGDNSNGQLNVPAPNSGFMAISAGFGYSLGLRSDGSVAAWGYNDDGQLNVPAPNSGFVAVSAGGNHSLATQDAHIVSASVFYTGHGSVVPATQTVLHGETASLDLVPDPGYHVACLYDNGVFKNAADPYVINYLTENHEVMAVFEANTYLIGASTDGSGSVRGAGDYEYGTTATLTATPSTGWHFVNWTEGGGEVSTEANYSLTVTGGRNLVAHFAIDSYPVNASVFYTGHGTVDPASQSVAYGGIASIDLVPDTGYHVAYLYDNGLFQEVTDPYVIDDVSGTHNILVVFDIETYLIDVDTDGSGSVGGGGSYEYGDPVTVSAVPDPGWYFVNWTEGGVEVSIDASYSFTAAAARDLIAHFALIPTDTWYLAEGSTAGGMETWVLVQNPNPFPVTLDVTFAEGAVMPPEMQGYILPAETRVSFDAGAYAQTYDLSTIVKATGGGIVVERSMYGPDRAWASESIGAPDTDTYWYLAEGSTGEGFETWVLVFNPGDTPVTCSLDFMTSAGPQAGPQDVELPALSRRSFKLNDYLTDYDVSTRVAASGGVIAERAMYGNDRAWAHASIGADVLAPVWYLAEGSTGPGFETWLLVQNPREAATDVDITLMTSSGPENPPELQGVPIPAHARRSFRLNDYLTDYETSILVVSYGEEVICERSIYNDERTWGTCSVGTPSPAQTWYLAEGCTGEGFETWVLVQNPAPDTVLVDLDFMTSSGEQAGPQDVLIPAFSRRSFRLNDYLTDYDVSTVVSSSGWVVCERAMYGADRAWATGSVGYAP